MRRSLLLSVSCVVLVLLVGCKKDGEGESGAEAKAAGGCEALLEKLKECSDEQPTSSEEAEFLEKCEKNKDSDRFQDMMACSSEATCDGFKTCQKDRRAKARLAEDLKELKEKPEDGKYTCERLLEEAATKDNAEVKTACEAVHKAITAKELAAIKKEFDAGKISSALSNCKYRMKDDLLSKQESFMNFCKQLPKDAVAALTKVVTANRDSGKKGDYNDCYNLKKAAETVGEAEGKAAKLLCREADTAVRVAEVITKTKEEMKTDKPSIPYGCEMRETDLQKIDSEWSKKQLISLGQACYHDLGKHYLTKKTAETYCGMYDKKIVAGLQKYPSKDAALNALVEALKSGRCKGKI